MLQWIFRGGLRGTTPLKEYTFEQSKQLQNPEVEEPDPGPAEAWKWSHMDFDWEDFVWSVHCRELRAWGYVMWDNARLSEYIYTQPFTLPPLPDEEELERRKEATISSMVKRKHLFRKGAKGWWAEEDESHLEWGDPPEFSDDEDWEERFIELVSDL